MKRLLAFLLIAFLAFAPLPAASKQMDFLKSIRPLQDVHEDGSVHTFCTTWATKLGWQNIRVWVTAAHCVLGEDGKPIKGLLVDGKPAQVVAVNGNYDLAMLSGGAVKDAKGLTVALGAPEIGDPIVMFGYPYSMPFFSAGVVGNPDRADIPDDAKDNFQLYDITSAPGNSGSPVMTPDGLVVGTLSGGWGVPGAPSSLTYGLKLKRLRTFLYGE